MSARRVTAVLAAATVLLPTAVTAGPAAAAEATDWQQVPLPASVTSPAMLRWVTATDPANAWAVGGEAVTGRTAGTPLILRWDGAAWTKSPLPALPWNGVLHSVAAASRLDAWAVGEDTTGRSRLLRWNGRQWREAPVPGSATVALRTVAAGPLGSAWLVGYDGDRPVVLRWDGSVWRPVPPPMETGRLAGVRVTWRGVWVTGQDRGSGQDLGLVARRTATGWATVTTAAPVSVINDVLVAGTGDLWAAGAADIRGPGGLSLTQPWIGHWNGTAWDVTQRTPATTIEQNVSITPDRAGRPQWIGSIVGANPATTRYARFDGTAWTEVSGAPLTGVFIAGTATAHIPGTNATWSVTALATQTPDGFAWGTPLIERHDGG
ncbi:hypothetical protein AB0F81_37980 [Actinoplanes sp. NPDC024001]|uniref:hypothetical protein n=1 Tax=Actinoplanes sp. NPDC024001 TaxID=3154598 RepID=UPI0033EF5D99